MKLGFTRRLPIIAGGIAISAMVGLTAGCGADKEKAPETSTSTTTTTTTTTAPPPPPPAPVAPTENAPRTPGQNPFTSVPPSERDRGTRSHQDRPSERDQPPQAPAQQPQAPN